jgi:hypothetical protein
MKTKEVIDVIQQLIKSVNFDASYEGDDFPLNKRVNIAKKLRESFDEMNKTAAVNRRIIEELSGYSDRLKSLVNVRQRVIMEQIHDILADYIETTDDFKTFIKETYDDYPALFNADFNTRLLERPEFGARKIPIQTGDKGAIVQTKTAAQKFVKSFISPHTPYNGLMLWHGVGTGKTRAAISIAENFTGFQGAGNQGAKKVIILLPSGTLEGNWRDEIFNVEKYIQSRRKDAGFGRKYAAELEASLPRGASDETVRRMAKRIVDKYFEIRGYLEFANKIKRDLETVIKFNANRETARIDYIRNQYSNCLIIMDEVHVTREGSNTNDKASRIYLELIARYATNTKMVLLSATPMYNTTDEIIWLLNLLLWNDKRAPLLRTDYFEADGVTLRDGALPKLVDRCRGYISYLRGENPFTFPLKLEPTDDQVIAEFASTRAIQSGRQVPITTRISGLKFYRAQMSEFQYTKLMDVYLDEEHAGDLDREESEDVEDVDEMEGELKMKSAFSATISQASNIVFPGRAGDAYIGRDGIKECFRIAEGRYELRPHALDWNDTGLPFLHRDNLAEFSQKFANILSCIEKNRRGLTFIYSQFIDAGVLSMSLILEANGFVKYEGEDKESTLISNFKCPADDRFCAKAKRRFGDLTEAQRREFKQARFVVLDGTMDKGKLTRLVREVRGEREGRPNLRGEHVLIVLGSRVVEQGISFKSVRDTHITDPWFHLNSMEQAAGRSIRNFSHMSLPAEERNVTLYLHVSSAPSEVDTELETTDERIYRIAYEKKEKMSAVERELKRNAIDCALNANSNYFVADQYEDGPKPLENRTIINSRGETIDRQADGDKVASKGEKTDLYDRDKSLLCDLDKCEYKCEAKPSRKLSDLQRDLVNVDAFFIEDDLDTIKDYIGFLFQSEMMFAVDPAIIYESLVRRKVELIGDESIIKHNIMTALREIETNHEVVVDKYNRKGVLQSVDIDGRLVWVFHPDENRNEVEMGLEERMIPNPLIRRHDDDPIKADKYEPPKIVAPIITRADIVKEVSDEYEKILAAAHPYEMVAGLRRTYNDRTDPSIGDMTKAIFHSYLDELSVAKRRALIEAVIVAGDEAMPEVREYLGETPRQSPPVRWFNLLKEEGRIVGYRIVNEKGQTEYVAWMNGAFSLVRNMDRFSDVNKEINQVDMTQNSQTQFGYQYEKKPGDGQQFFTVARDGDIVRRRDNKIHKRALIKGAKCGDSKLNKTFFRPELIDLVATEVKNSDVDVRESYTASKTINKKTLCDEIALLWRIKDLKKGRYQSRFFYNAEEARLFFRTFQEM